MDTLDTFVAGVIKAAIEKLDGDDELSRGDILEMYIRAGIDFLDRNWIWKRTQ